MRRERTYQKYGHPGHADIIEGNRALKGILPLRHTDGVVLVPVDAGRVRRLVQVKQLGLLCEWR